MHCNVRHFSIEGGKQWDAARAAHKTQHSRERWLTDVSLVGVTLYRVSLSSEASLRKASNTCYEYSYTHPTTSSASRISPQ